MAIVVTHKLDGSSSTGASSYTTASQTDTGTRYYLLAVIARASVSAVPNTPTISGKGLTWDVINTQAFDASNPTRKKVILYRAYGTASSGTITIDFGGQTQTHCMWLLEEVTGMDTSGTNGSGAIVQSATSGLDNTSGIFNHSATLSAFADATNNAVFGVFSSDNSTGAGNFTPDGSLTNLLTPLFNSVNGVTAWAVGEDTTPSGTWDDDISSGGVIAVEIKVAGSGAQTLLPDLFTHTKTIYAPSISQVGVTQTLSPSLFTKTKTFFSPTVVNNAITVDHVLSGAVTHNSARVIARLSAEATVVLEYATNSGFTGSDTTSSVGVTSGNDLIADFSLSGLSANTQYYYRVVINGVADTTVGKFKTYSTGAYSFTYAFSGDADIVDSQDVYTRIVARNPQFFFALGDTPYIDNTAASVTNYQNGFKDWFGDATVSSMLQAFQYEYIWDDHDYADNNSNSSATGKTYAQDTYRQHIPHYPLEDADAIYHSFQVGRVLFLVTDLRSERTGSTFMSSTQMTWFKGEITAAASDSSIGLIVWANSIPWIDTSGTSTDTWDGADAQRTEIANHITSVGMQNNFCIISADAHMVAADDGTNSEGGFPVFQSAPLNRSNSTKGGPYSEGTYASSNGQYSIMSITDDGTDIAVNVKGYNGSDTQLYSFDFTATALSTTLSPPLVTKTKTIYSPTITTEYTISPSLFTHTKTFFSPTIVQAGGPQTLEAPLITKTKTFYTPEVTLGAVTVSVPLVTKDKIFYNAEITSGYTISPPLVTKSKVIYSPEVTTSYVISPPLITKNKIFYSATVEGGEIIEGNNGFYFGIARRRKRR